MYQESIRDVYENNKIARFEKNGIIVSTIYKNNMWETAISHPKFGNGKIIIVQTNDCCSDCARIMHQKWVTIMTKKIPKKRIKWRRI